MVINIRRAKTEDIIECMRLKEYVWLATYVNRKYKITKSLILGRGFLGKERLQKEREKLKNPNIRTYVAFHNRKVVGICSSYKQAKINSIGSLYVLPKYQNHSVGTRLMLKALGWLGEKKPVSLIVAEYNNKAINFYNKFGFKFIKAVPGPLLSANKSIPSVEIKRKVKGIKTQNKKR